MTSTKPYYDAEHEVEFILRQGGTTDFYGSMLTLPEVRKFGNLESVKSYVDKVYHFMGYTNPPKVRRRRGDKKAHYELTTHTIAIPDHRGSRHSWAMDECTVLHEVAHALTPFHGHDEHFCSQLVHLYNKIIGPEAGLLLAAAFDARGITVKLV